MKEWNSRIAAIAMVANGLFSIYKTCVSANALTRSRQVAARPQDQIVLAVILPLYNEVDRVQGTVDHWMSHLAHYPELVLCPVTTTREGPEAENPTRKSLIAHLSAADRCIQERVLPIHYPRCNRTYGEQLDWGVREVISLRIDVTHVYVANVDSRIGVEAVEDLLDACYRGVSIAQQSSVFLRDLRGRGLWSAAECIYQSRWTLEVEVFRYLAGSGSIQGIPGWISRRWYQHAVGHGCLMSREAYIALGGYAPPRYGLEDAALGVRARAHGYSILPLHTLECGDGPRSMAELFRQRSTWVRGPLCAPEYALPFGRLDLAAQGMWDGLKWSLGLPFLCVLLSQLKRGDRIVGFIGLGLGNVGPVVVLARFLRSGPRTMEGFAWPDFLWGVRVYPLASLSYWVGGFAGLLRLVWDIGLRRNWTQPATRRTSE